MHTHTKIKQSVIHLEIMLENNKTNLSSQNTHTNNQGCIAIKCPKKQSEVIISFPGNISIPKSRRNSNCHTS